MTCGPPSVPSPLPRPAQALSAPGRVRVQGFRERSEGDSLFLKCPHRPDQLSDRAANSVKLPDHEDVAAACKGDCLGEARPLGFRAGREIHEHWVATDALQCLELHLRSRSIVRNPRVADERHSDARVRLTVPKPTATKVRSGCLRASDEVALLLGDPLLLGPGMDLTRQNKRRGRTGTMNPFSFRHKPPLNVVRGGQSDALATGGGGGG